MYFLRFDFKSLRKILKIKWLDIKFTNLIDFSSKALPLPAPLLNLLEFGDNLQTLVFAVVFGHERFVFFQDLFKNGLAARMSADESPLEHININSLVLNFTTYETEAEVNEIELVLGGGAGEGFGDLISFFFETELLSFIHHLLINLQIGSNHHIGCSQISVDIVALMH